MKWTNEAAGDAAARLITAMLSEESSDSPLVRRMASEAVNEADPAEVLLYSAGVAAVAIKAAALSAGASPLAFWQEVLRPQISS